MKVFFGLYGRLTDLLTDCIKEVSRLDYDNAHHL